MYYSFFVHTRRLAVFILLLGVGFVGYSTNLSSEATPFGNWNTNGTWNAGSTPSSTNCVDTIYINQHVYFTTQQNLTSCSPIVLFIRDTLRFKNGPKLYLPVGSQVILDSSGLIMPEGSGSSSAIDVGGVEFWKADDGVVHGPLNLPVDLLYFNAEVKKKRVHFEWATAMELNANYFSLQVLNDASEWTEVDMVRCAGNSSHKLVYKHSIPYEKESIYRLMQTDYDGQTHLLASIWVREDEIESTIELSPNPGRDFIQVNSPWDLDDQTTISIVNSNGQVVWTKLCESHRAVNQEILDVKGLVPGVYSVQITRADRPVRSATIMIQ